MIKQEPRWVIPKEWSGQTAVIIGGGHSLRIEDVEYAKQKDWRRIACNNAYTIDPDADVLVWGDRRWYQWNRYELHKHTGPYKITWQDVDTTSGIKFHILKHADQPPTLRQHLEELSRYEGTSEVPRLMNLVLQFSKFLLAEDPGTISATSTGQGAINAAYHFGVSRIVLLGFDMYAAKERDGKWRHNWHGLHKRETDFSRYKSGFAPAIWAMATILRAKGIEVINSTHKSQLPGVPIMELETL